LGFALSGIANTEMKQKLVFCEMHHNDLHRSLEILFEKRLGWKLFYPIGLDWSTTGIWKYACVPETKDAVTRQYLEGHTEDIQVERGSFLRYNPTHRKTNRMITLSKFFEMPIDIVIASVQNHEESFYKLAQSHWNNPKFIRQIGNWGELIDFNYSKNIMLSAIPTVPMPKDINYVSYHQEFDLNIFKYEEPKETKTITNFMNCLPASRYYPLYLQYEKLLPDFKWKMHGILGKDGIIGNVWDIAKIIKESAFGIHLKYGGDGYGHALHNFFACGRPVITCCSDYKNKFGELLLEDKITCIDLEAHSIEDNVKLIRYFSIPKNHRKMCQNVYERFCKVVNFDAEFLKLKDFLDKLQ